MKKIFIVWIAFTFALSMVGLTLAQEKTQKNAQEEISKPAIEKTKDTKPDEAKVKAKEKRQIFAKSYIWRMGGLITAVDAQAKTLSLRQKTVDHDWVMKLRASENVAKELLNIKPGDLVNVWVRGKVITALNRVG